MNYQSEKANRERGGIRLRDYTRGSDLMSLDHQFQSEGLRGSLGNSLEKINFDKVARGLTWFSLGLGLMEVLMPGRVQRMIGIRRGDHTGLIRLMGIREIASAVWIMMQSRPRNGVMSRVAGDLLDLGLLGAAYSSPRVKKNRLTTAAASVAGVMALDALTASQLSKQKKETKQASALTNADLNSRRRNGAFHVSRSITINRSPEELYQYWRNFENLPHFMYHLESVQVIDDRRSHWVSSAPAGTQVSWDAEITQDRPNQLIAWQSLPGADVTNTGIVRFEPAPAGRGTVVRVDIEYRPPGGAIGRAFAQVFGEEPAQQVKGELHRFKQVMETGAVVRSEGSPEGRGQKLQHAARPMSDGEARKQGKSFLGKLMPGKLFSKQDDFDKERDYLTDWSSERTRTR